MEFVDFFLHAEAHLQDFTRQHGTWVYALLFLIVFCETGLVVTPFLPGDSLLFAVGALAGAGWIDFELSVALLLTAAILGDALNYSIGAWCGPKVCRGEGGRFFRRDHLRRAEAFYEKYGGRAIVLARFVPIVRTFAPFVAGAGSMAYRRFAFYNVTGAILWVGLFCGAGYLFGGIPVVQEHMKLIILGIIIVSVLPIALEYWRATRERAVAASEGP